MAYVPVGLCGANKGRLVVQPSGVVSVEAEGGAFANAQCLTSLEGVSFAVSTSGFTPLVLQNGWTHAPYSTSAAAVRGNGQGFIYFMGAIANGTSGAAFTIPAGMAPFNDTYVPIDLCNATKGRLLIHPSGLVEVQTEGSFGNATCFTSLEGAGFASNGFGFSALTPLSGWLTAPYGTTNPQARLFDGIVHLRGAVWNGSSAVLFMLPAGMEPPTNVFVPVDLCNATKGLLTVEPSGRVSVTAANGAFGNAQCFTSLDGAWFEVPTGCFVSQNQTSSDSDVVHGWDLGGYSDNVLRGPRDCGGVRVSSSVSFISGGANGACSVVDWANTLCNANPNMMIGNSTITAACTDFFNGGSDLGNNDCRYIVHESGAQFFPPFGASNEITCSASHTVSVQVPAPCP